eukprot:scaffold2482_cov166-Amphora_coffeaeformis.AAC.9
MADNGYPPNDGDDDSSNHVNNNNDMNGYNAQQQYNAGTGTTTTQPDIGWLFGQLGSAPGSISSSNNNNATSSNPSNINLNQQPGANNNFQALFANPFPTNPSSPATNPPSVPPPANTTIQQIQAFLNQVTTPAPQPPLAIPTTSSLGQQPAWQMPTTTPQQFNQQQQATINPQQMMQLLAMITAGMQTRQQQQQPTIATNATPNPFQQFHPAVNNNNMATFPFLPMFGQPPPMPQQLPWNLTMNGSQSPPPHNNNDLLMMFTTFLMSALQQQLANQNAVVARQQLSAMMQAVFPPLHQQQGMPHPNVMGTAAGSHPPQPSFSSEGGTAVATVTASSSTGSGGAAVASGKTTKGAPKKKKRAYNHEGFPSKLHRLILEAKAQGKDHIIRFTDNGLQFQILDTAAFETEILPVYFRHGHISSFKRLLRMYCFRRTQGTWEEGTFEHEKFQRDAPDLCKEITRAGPLYGSMY